MPEPDLAQIVTMVVIGTLLNFAVIFLLSFVLQFIVALKSRPARRAIWTVAPPFLLVALGVLIWGPQTEVASWLPVAAIPAALIAFAYWYWTFRRAWIEDPDNLPDGASLSNDDWKIGLAVVLFVVALDLAREVFLASFDIAS